MTADATLPASDDLTPEVLARWEEFTRGASMQPWVADRMGMVMGVGHWVARSVSKGDATFIEMARAAIPALLSGVRSRDARIAELENEMERDVAKMSRITELEDARDEVQEKIAYLRRNCMGMEWQQLVQKIGAVGSAEWARGYYWNTLVAEHRDKQAAAEVAQRTAERRVAELEAEVAARDAVIAGAVAQFRYGSASQAERILSAAPSSVLAARDAATWDACLDAIEQNELNTGQAREGNPYLAGVHQ